MKRVKRFIISFFSYILPSNVAILVSRFFLATQGIGYAVDVEDSGELKIVKRLITSHNPVIFDVGANIGNWSYNVLGIFKRAEIHIFEPSKPHFELLSKKLVNFQRRCFINNFGLSNETESLKLHKNDEITGSATLCESTNIYKNLKNITEEVDLISGEKYLKKNNIKFIDFLKIDVEGWEFPVLKGFENLIDRNSINFVQFEITPNNFTRSESFRDFFDFFSSKNYKVSIIKPSGKLKFIYKDDEIFNTFLPTNFLAINNNISIKET